MAALLEICCYGVDDAIIAAKAGAHRIELCAGASEGGITPSYAVLEQVASLIQLPVAVMIRPRGGDFCYSTREIDVMCRDIETVRKLGFSSVVFGALNPKGELDERAMSSLMEASDGLQVTFHRAFDMGCDPLGMAEQLAWLGVTRILTSGQQTTAIHGMPLLSEIQSAVKDLIIMPGGGVRADNLNLFLKAGFRELHSSACQMVPSVMTFINPHVSMSSKITQSHEYQRQQASSDLIREMCEIINKYSY